MAAMDFIEILKFNPYHDSLGRFASANGATSMTYAPGKSKAHDNAIEREKERQAAETAAAPAASKYSKEEQIQAVKDFTISDYHYIRKIQTGKKPGFMDEEEYQSYVKKGEAIEEYIAANSSHKGEIWRGINTKGDEGFKVGQKIDMRGTSSWTTDKEIGVEWAGVNGSVSSSPFKSGKEKAYVFHMKQSPKKCAYIDDISENKGEKEVLVSTNTRFKITHIETTERNTIVTVEEA